MALNRPKMVAQGLGSVGNLNFGALETEMHGNVGSWENKTTETQNKKGSVSLDVMS